MSDELYDESKNSFRKLNSLNSSSLAEIVNKHLLSLNRQISILDEEFNYSLQKKPPQHQHIIKPKKLEINFPLKSKKIKTALFKKELLNYHKRLPKIGLSPNPYSSNEDERAQSSRKKQGGNTFITTDQFGKSEYSFEKTNTMLKRKILKPSLTKQKPYLMTESTNQSSNSPKRGENRRHRSILTIGNKLDVTHELLAEEVEKLDSDHQVLTDSIIKEKKAFNKLQKSWQNKFQDAKWKFLINDYDKDLHPENYLGKEFEGFEKKNQIERLDRMMSLLKGVDSINNAVLLEKKIKAISEKVKLKKRIKKEKENRKVIDNILVQSMFIEKKILNHKA